MNYTVTEFIRETFNLSHRAYHRILRLARTIADLALAEIISTHHLGEAIGYRKLERIPSQSAVITVKTDL